jgi:transcriptional regulator of nitric oxide reductase
MRQLAALALVVLAGVAGPAIDTQLKALFPAATTFSDKGGDPPHFKAFVAPSALTGFAFWTTELDPLERGYGGPIKILVGMTTGGTLAGVVVVDHREPFGYFSIDRPEFAAQFKGKNIRDPFKVGGDVDAVSRATMSVTSATRAIRDSARLAARRLLPAGR